MNPAFQRFGQIAGWGWFEPSWYNWGSVSFLVVTELRVIILKAKWHFGSSWMSRLDCGTTLLCWRHWQPLAPGRSCFTVSPLSRRWILVRDAGGCWEADSGCGCCCGMLCTASGEREGGGGSGGRCGVTSVHTLHCTGLALDCTISHCGTSIFHITPTCCCSSSSSSCDVMWCDVMCHSHTATAPQLRTTSGQVQSYALQYRAGWASNLIII